MLVVLVFTTLTAVIIVPVVVFVVSVLVLPAVVGRPGVPVSSVPLLLTLAAGTAAGSAIAVRLAGAARAAGTGAAA